MPGEGPGLLARRALQGAAICEAVQRPAMRFVPVKSELAQCRLAIHTVREGWVKARTATINRLLDELRRLDTRVAEYDAHIQMMARADERSTVLMQVPGIGPTTASALVASIGNGHDFANGRQLAARAVLAAAVNKADRISRWATTLAERRGYWKAVVAIAAKNARMAWAMLAKGENSKPIA